MDQLSNQSFFHWNRNHLTRPTLLLALLLSTIKFWARSFRSRDEIRSTIVEHRSGNCAGFSHPESFVSEIWLENALLLRTEPEPSPESTARIFSTILSTQLGRVDSQHRVYDLRFPRSIHDSELETPNQIGFQTDCRLFVFVDVIVIVKRRFNDVVLA
jgi:hypothetical protein